MVKESMTAETPTQTTVVERPRPVHTDSAAAVTAPVTAAGTPASSLEEVMEYSLRASPAAALERDESNRMRLFSIVVVGIALSAIAAILVVGGDPAAQKLHIAGCAVTGSGGLWSYLRLRAGAAYTTFQNTAFGLTGVFALTTGYFYWGPLSAVLLLVPFGAFIFSANRSLASALIVSGFAFGLHLVVSLLMIGDVIADRSVVQPIGLSKGAQVATVAIIQGIFVATFIVARGAHHSTERALHELRHAVRALSLRDQLLAEAQDELARALMLGGAGRYSNATLGNYQLGGVIGRGAMGEVYEARDLRDQSPAAVKVLAADVLASPQHVRRFIRELEMIATIDSPHVVRVLEVASIDGGLPYLAMERLQGRVLSQHLQERGRLELDEVVDMARQVGRGLRAAHEQGVLHRDIKPQNLFLTDDGRWTILDFGVAKLMDSDANLTQGRIIGTPAYMSPEQARGEAMDGTSDLYSLAVVCYRALVGRAPVAGKAAPEILGHVTRGLLRRPRGLGPHSADIEAVLAIAMARRPADRFSDGEQLASALERAGRGELGDELRRRAARLGTFGRR